MKRIKFLAEVEFDVQDEDAAAIINYGALKMAPNIYISKDGKTTDLKYNHLSHETVRIFIPKY